MIQLSHIGEELISRILYESKEARDSVCDNMYSPDTEIDVQAEVKLENCGMLSFDGTHKIDVAILNPNSLECFPMEAKLGFNRLGKNEFEKRFLKRCETSHNYARVKGSMIAILERNLPTDCVGKELFINHKNTPYIVSVNWALICRAKVLDKWNTSGRPGVSSKCKIISFESLVEMYGGGNALNSLIKELVSFDYYQKWKCSF